MKRLTARQASYGYLDYLSFSCSIQAASASRVYALRSPAGRWQTENGHSLSMINGQFPTPCGHLPVSIRLMATTRFADTVKSSYMVPRNPVAI